MLSSPIITLVDPYFGQRDNNNQFDTLKRMVELLRNSDVYVPTVFNPTKNIFKKFLIHCLEKDQNHINSVQSTLDQYVSSLTGLSQGIIEFKIIFWKYQKRLHNRYVLSRSGGIMFGHGLDPDQDRDDIATISDYQDYKNMFISTENELQTYWKHSCEYAVSTPNP